MIKRFLIVKKVMHMLILIPPYIIIFVFKKELFGHWCPIFAIFKITFIFLIQVCFSKNINLFNSIIFTQKYNLRIKNIFSIVEK